MPHRNCSACNRSLWRDSYSRNQWSKGEGCSRCHSCVNSGSWSNNGRNNNNNNNINVDDVLERLRLEMARMKLDRIVKRDQTVRRNNATRATFTRYALDHPFASGSFRWVAKGVYTEGFRTGEDCVCKWFKTGGVLESSFFDADLKTVQKALELIAEWNVSEFVNKIVKINKPEVWTFSDDSGYQWAGKKVLQEPFIQNYQKFNSNTGWADDSIPWARVMQALSHYTYDASNGTCLVCDLQGGVYSDGVVLTDPVVMSIDRSYGPTDLGIKGMHSFFANHKCNEFCRSAWKKIVSPICYHEANEGTSMEYVPTRHSRPKMSMAMGAIYE